MNRKDDLVSIIRSNWQLVSGFPSDIRFERGENVSGPAFTGYELEGSRVASEGSRHSVLIEVWKSQVENAVIVRRYSRKSDCGHYSAGGHTEKLKCPIGIKVDLDKRVSRS